MKDILIKIVESDKAMVILVVGCLGGGLIIKLADPTNAVTPIVTGLNHPMFMKMVIPFSLFNRSMISRNCFTPKGSNPAVGSSRNSTLGS